MVKSDRAQRASDASGCFSSARGPALGSHDNKCGSELAITYVSPDDLTEAPRNARTHSGKQVSQIRLSIEKNGFANPVLVDEKFVVIAGHGRLMAARKLSMTSIPVIILNGLSEMQKRQLAIAAAIEMIAERHRLPQIPGLCSPVLRPLY